MIQEQIVSKTASDLVRALDDEAALETLMQASNCHRKGDAEGEAFWLLVQDAVDKLLTP